MAKPALAARFSKYDSDQGKDENDDENGDCQ